MDNIKKLNRQLDLIRRFIAPEWVKIFKAGAGAILLEFSAEDDYFNIVSLIGEDACCDEDVQAIHDYNELRKIEELTWGKDEV